MSIRLFRKHNIWLPTWPTAVLLIGGSLILAGLLFFSSHGFLAINKPAGGAKVMVVESWLTDSSMHKVAQLLEEGSPYESVWLAGPVLDRGFYLADRFKTSGEMGSATLQQLGVPAELLHVAPAADSQRHRTHTAASKLKGEFDRLGISPDRFDVVTIDVHARRSRLVYQKVFGDAVEIGVIALEPNNYDADTWFRTSAGMKNTIVEAIAYLYEKLADGGR